MIKSVYTSSVVYHTANEAEEYMDKINITDCTLTQTDYGSVIIERKSHKTVELYPQAIQHIIHNK